MELPTHRKMGESMEMNGLQQEIETHDLAHQCGSDQKKNKKKPHGQKRLSVQRRRYI